MAESKLIKILLVSLEEDGCTIKPTKKGYLVKFPNGETTTFHKTPSDHRAVLNLRACIKRNGCTWPSDGKQPQKKLA